MVFVVNRTIWIKAHICFTEQFEYCFTEKFDSDKDMFHWTIWLLDKNIFHETSWTCSTKSISQYVFHRTIGQNMFHGTSLMCFTKCVSQNVFHRMCVNKMCVNKMCVHKMCVHKMCFTEQLARNMFHIRCLRHFALEDIARI